MINFDEPIVYGRLIKRYQRFFMDVLLNSGESVTAHTPNTGSMMGLLEKDSAVMLTHSENPKRRTAYTAQAIRVGGTWVGINTHLPNRLVKESLEHPLLADLTPYSALKAEAPYGPGMRSRIDLLFSNSSNGEPPLYVEIKNVTLRVGDHAQFPDAVSVRAQKHIEDLLYVRRLGFKASLLFIVQRQDCKFFSPAIAIDETYAKMLSAARLDGLTIRALGASIDDQGVRLTHELPCLF